jgi:hypothetical protein
MPPFRKTTARNHKRQFAAECTNCCHIKELGIFSTYVYVIIKTKNYYLHEDYQTSFPWNRDVSCFLWVRNRILGVIYKKGLSGRHVSQSSGLSVCLWPTISASIAGRSCLKFDAADLIKFVRQLRFSNMKVHNRDLFTSGHEFNSSCSPYTGSKTLLKLDMLSNKPDFQPF